MLDTVHLQAIHCSLSISRPAPNTVVLTLVGRDVGELGERPFIELAHDLEKSSSLAVFIDARAALGASLEVSHDWAHWMKTHRDKLAAVSLLTGSRFIEITADMVRKFSEVSDRTRIYTEAAAFDDALALAAEPRARAAAP